MKNTSRRKFIGSLAALLCSTSVVAAQTPFTTFSFNATNGTNPRTMPNRLADLRNILDFGADPTGVADSQPAFQAAANLGSPVFCPGGTYTLHSSVTLSGGGSGVGRDAIFFGSGINTLVQSVSAGLNGFLFDFSSNADSQTIRLDGFYIKNTSILSTSGAVRLLDMSGASVRNCFIQGYVGVWISSSFTNTIDSCCFLGLSGSYDNVTSATWSSTNGGQIALVLPSPSQYKLGKAVEFLQGVGGITNSGSAGAAYFTGSNNFIINTFTDSQHFTVMAPATAGQIGTLGGTLQIRGRPPGSTGFYVNDNVAVVGCVSEGFENGCCLAGAGIQLVGCHFESNNDGMVCGLDPTGASFPLGASSLDGITCENNLVSLFIANASGCRFGGINLTGAGQAPTNSLIDGMYISSGGHLVFDGCAAGGNWDFVGTGTSAGFNMDGNSVGNIVFNSCIGQSWILPSAASLSGIFCNQSDNPTLAIPFSGLPGQAGVNYSPAVEGMTYDIIDSNDPAWTGTVSNVGKPITTGGGSNHVRVRRNSSGWEISG